MKYEQKYDPADAGTLAGPGKFEQSAKTEGKIPLEEQKVNSQHIRLVAWETYLARIEATVDWKNPLRATIGGDESGYRRASVVVKAERDGSVVVKPEGTDKEPTDDEAKAIAAELALYSWPELRPVC